MMQQMGFVVMLTGDNRALGIVHEVGIKRVIVEVRPDQKASQVRVSRQKNLDCRNGRGWY